MSDVALVWNTDLGAADMQISANDLLGDDGLETAVFLSLFTDRRAGPSDQLPDFETDRRGWWGDAVPVVDGDLMGSRLWMLSRSKQTQEVLDRAQEYTAEALEWLVEDLVASRVDVESVIVGNGILGIGVTIHRPDNDSVTYRYQYNWASQEAKRA